MLKEEVMPKKIVIKIRARDGAYDFTTPLDFGLAHCYCCVMPGDAPRINSSHHRRQTDARSVG